MMQVLTYWRMAWFRAALYMGVVGWNTFDSLTEDINDQVWQGMGSFLRSRIVARSVVSAIMTLIAFLDTTMGQLRAAKPVDIPPIKIESAPAAQPEPETKK